jgi:hypothetical protein
LAGALFSCEKKVGKKEARTGSLNREKSCYHGDFSLNCPCAGVLFSFMIKAKDKRTKRESRLGCTPEIPNRTWILRTELRLVIFFCEAAVLNFHAWQYCNPASRVLMHFSIWSSIGCEFFSALSKLCGPAGI